VETVIPPLTDSNRRRGLRDFGRPHDCRRPTLNFPPQTPFLRPLRVLSVRSSCRKLRLSLPSRCSLCASAEPRVRAAVVYRSDKVGRRGGDTNAVEEALPSRLKRPRSSRSRR